MVTRKIDWIASIKAGNFHRIVDLENKLAEFYAKNSDYYSDIDFTGGNWIDKTEAGYAEIVNQALASENICEFGCGSANILKHFPELQEKYSGCDFSETLMQRNQAAFPQASFKTIERPNLLPFEDYKFDLVFSVFVLEHSTSPSRLLDECKRILKPGGKLIILCPDFMGQGKMSSQRAGWSAGTAVSKLKRKRYLDALITLFDNRIRIPFHCGLLFNIIKIEPQFFINVCPTIFEDPFIPDVDAIYITCRQEIENYLSSCFIIEENSIEIQKYIDDKKLIFLKMTKK